MQRKMVRFNPRTKNLAQRKIEESTFADGAEMTEILSRPELVKRLRAGSRDARRRKDLFVAGTHRGLRM